MARFPMLLLSAAMLLPIAPVAAGPYEDATAAYSRGDYATALRLLRPLANQGNAAAQNDLGYLFATGHGVLQNYVEAVKWFRLSASQGDVGAQYNLGVMYDNGRGVPQNYAEALNWYRLAADQDHALAQRNLGSMYYKGEGVPQDYVRAHMWLNLSATQGDQDAAKSRDIVAKLMTPAQIAEAQKLAREWRPKQP